MTRDAASTSRVVHPLRLVTKGTTSYLVANTDAGLGTFRVDRVTAVHGTGNAAARPAGFDLDEAWRSIANEVDLRRAAVARPGLGTF
ncbi:MAG: WYL domain-containing protein [Acidimicrobiia bacterium]